MQKHKIKFLASCFDVDSLKLYSSLNNDTVKIPSGEINNLHLIEYAAKKFKKLIISTGMSNYLEIAKAIKTVIKQGVSKKYYITSMHHRLSSLTRGGKLKLHGRV